MSALNQISGNSFAGLTTINTDLTIEGNLDVNGSIEFSDITMGNALITGDLVVIGSILEQNTNNNLLSLNVTNGVLLNCTISNLKLTNSTATNILLTNLTSSKAFITDITTTNLVLTNSTATNILLTNLSGSKAFVTDITSTNLVVTNSTIGSITNVSNVNFANRKLLINATGANLNPSNFTVGSLVISANNDITNSTKSGCYISNIEFDDTQNYTQVLNYNSTSKEITYKPYIFGSFACSATQSLNQTTANLIMVDTTLSAVGLSLSSNKITVSQTGYYKIGIRAHVTQTVGSASSCTLYLKKNGTNISYSGTDVYVPGSNAENGSYFEIIIQMNKNDYIEAYVYTTDTNLQLSHNAATGVLPVVPGINITMFQI
tara:strand:+ start:197 stop:1324 length:1128 start_codon:yes stop_codon:yes gene_type:complete